MSKESEILALESKLAVLRGSATPEQNKSAKQYDQAIADAYVTAVPRTKYAELINRQIKQLNDLANTYEGFPTPPGHDVNLVEVINWFHDFLTEWGPKIKKNQLADEKSLEVRFQADQLEIRKVQAQIAKLEADVEKKRATAIPIDDVKRLFSYLAGELRKLGERLGKRYGAEAQVAMNETLLRIERSIQEDL